MSTLSRSFHPKNPNRNTNFFFSHSSILHMTTLLVFFSFKNSMPCVLTIDHPHFYSFFIYTYQLNFLFSSPYKPFHPLFLPTDPFSFPCFFSRFVPFFFLHRFQYKFRITHSFLFIFRISGKYFFSTSSKKLASFLVTISISFIFLIIFYIYLLNLINLILQIEKESFIGLSKSMTNSTCGGAESDLCRDESAAFILKFIAMASILLAGMAGIAIPLIGKHRRFLKTDGNLFVAAKAFAAGVILATGFVHMLSDATKALNSPCLPEFPWSKFPFTGFFAMMAALFTLLLDFVGTQYYERKQGVNRSVEEQARVGTLEEGIAGKVFGEEESGGMHIVGMHAHAAHHRHHHAHGNEACDGHGIMKEEHGHSHAHALGNADEETDVRHVVVSQVIYII